jgi:DNA ligase-1
MALYTVKLLCVDAEHDKFYIMQIVDDSSSGGFVVVTTYGRNGCTGVRMESDPHATLGSARRVVDSMVAKKLAKGYKAVGKSAEGGGGDGSAAADAAGDAPAAKKARTAAAADDTAADAPAAGKPSGKAAKADKPFSPMLAAAYNGSQQIDGWLMSEKLDGIRAIYHPEARELRTRTGKAIFAPPEFLAGFPAKLMLDGELFIAYGHFDKVSGIVRSGSNTSMARWAGVRFMVFDAPLVAGPFTVRLKAATAALAGVTHAAVLPHERIANAAALQAFHARIEAAGGEGVMVRDPTGAYVQSRSKLLLKVKKFQEEEATVTGHERGTGRLAALTGALTCRFADGTTFSCGSGMDDATRKDPPPVGTLITVKFFERTKDNKPRFPIFKGVRADL